MRKKALSLILLLLVAGMLLSGCSTPEDEYNKEKERIQYAVTEYMMDHSGFTPPHGDTINTSECKVYIGIIPEGGLIDAGYVLDFCLLQDYCVDCEYYEYFPFELSICCYGQSGEEGTNFYSGNCIPTPPGPG